MLCRETDKIIFVRINYKFTTWCNKNTVVYNILVQWKGAHCEVGVVMFMAVIFTQRDAACFS